MNTPGEMKTRLETDPSIVTYLYYCGIGSLHIDVELPLGKR